jgi:hypothetical protein
MRRSKAAANESKFPNIVELVIASDELDVALNRRIMDFHNARHIKPRHGQRIKKEGELYYRWCFSDLATARDFIEQFGGEFC